MSDRQPPAVDKDHPGFTVNKSGTRIRCQGAGCLLVLDIDDSVSPEQIFAAHLTQIGPTVVLEPAPSVPVVDDIFGELDEELAADSALAIPAPVIEDLVPEDVAAEPPATVVAADPLPPMVALLTPEIAAAEEHGENTAPVVESPALVPAAANEPVLPETIGTDEPVVPSKRRGKKKAPEVETPALVGPTTKRNLKDVTANLETIKAGDRVSATFRTPRYGEFTIEATVLAGLTFRSLVVGAWILGTAGKPTKNLQSVTRLAAKGKHEMAIIPGTDEHEHLGMVA